MGQAQHGPPGTWKVCVLGTEQSCHKSQNCFGWEGPLRSLSPALNPALPSPPLAKGKLECCSDLPRLFPRSPPHQSPNTSSWGTAMTHGHGTGWGTAQGSLQLSPRDFYPRVPTIVQPFLKFTADESLSYTLALRASLIKIPASSSSLIMEASLRPPTNARGERDRGALLQGLFGILSQSQTDVCKNLN